MEFFIVPVRLRKAWWPNVIQELGRRTLAPLIHMLILIQIPFLIMGCAQFWVIESQIIFANHFCFGFLSFDHSQCTFKKMNCSGESKVGCMTGCGTG